MLIITMIWITIGFAFVLCFLSDESVRACLNHPGRSALELALGLNVSTLIAPLLLPIALRNRMRHIPRR